MQITWLGILLKNLEVQLSYAIGVANPTSIFVETFGTSLYTDNQIIECMEDVFVLTSSEIIETSSKKLIYSKTAVLGYFGRDDIELSWEKLNM